MTYRSRSAPVYQSFRPTALYEIETGQKATPFRIRSIEQGFSKFPYIHDDVRFSKHSLSHMKDLSINQSDLVRELRKGSFKHIGDIHFLRKDQPQQWGYVLEMSDMDDVFVLATNVDGTLFVESVRDDPSHWSEERFAP